jgi:hypothetical protein
MVVVPVNTLDRYCEASGVAHVDLLKVDVEGGELDVLKGAGGLLGRKAVSLVQFEYSSAWISARVYLKDAIEYLMSYGYVVGKLFPDRVAIVRAYCRDDECFRYQNWLALSPIAVEWLQIEGMLA